jgi:hypothetical protein
MNSTVMFFIYIHSIVDGEMRLIATTPTNSTKCYSLHFPLSGEDPDAAAGGWVGARTRRAASSHLPGMVCLTATEADVCARARSACGGISICLFGSPALPVCADPAPNRAVMRGEGICSP